MQWAGWGLVGAALLLYAITIDNGLQPGELVGGDLITHQYAQVQARPSNAPGYPLYTMGGWLWFYGLRALLVAAGVPHPNPLPILSSYSTLWALLALWLLYRILCWQTRSSDWPAGNWLLAWLLSAFYGVTYFFWYYATTTEQYSSAIAQTLAIVYLYLCWQAQQTREDADGANARHGWPSRANRLLLGLALLCGVALAHMLTVAFIVPPLVVAVLWQAPRLLRNLPIVLGAIVAAALPLLSYGYVYLRGVAHPEWWGEGEWRTGTEWFWSFVSTAQGRAELGWGFEAWCTPFANGFPALIGAELSWPVVALGLIGLARLPRRFAFLCYGTLLLYLLFAWAYRCGNWFQVILPAYPLLLLGVAKLLHAPVAGAWGFAKGTRHRLLFSTVLLVLVGMVLARGVRSWPRADSYDRVADGAFDRAALLLATPLPAQSRLFAAVDDALALQYLFNIWQLRPDLAVVSSPDAAAHLAAGEAIYSTWDAAPTLYAELPDALAYTSVAVDPHWVRLQPRGGAAPARQLQHQPAIALLPEVTLQGYELQRVGSVPLATYRPTIARGAEDVVVTLAWQLSADQWPEGLSISVRLTANGVPLPGAQQDRARPARGLTEPRAGIWIDPYLFAAGTAPADGLLLVLYRQVADGFENVAVLPLEK